ncbi:MAG: hypothetical protein OEY33_08550 [Bdellovibrionales bacterium]|nr:hypothetical protein [Bdellovibrionales bacterium]
MKFIFTFILLLTANNAKALIFLEPYLNFNLAGYGEETKENGNIKKYEYNTVFYGARAGLSLFSLQFGGDYSKGQSVLQIDDETGRSTLKYEKEDIGFFINKTFIDWRIYVTYLFQTELRQKGGENQIQHLGTGQVVGIGRLLDDSLTLNFEFKNLLYTKERRFLPNNVIEVDKPSTLKVKEFVIGFSYMIDIFGGGKRAEKPAASKD